MEMKIGGCVFEAVYFPLVIHDRFFHFELDDAGTVLISIARWNERTREMEMEVRRSKPVGRVAQRSTGVRDTFVADRDGALFTFVAEPGTIISGRIATESIGVRIAHDEMHVLIDGQNFAVLRNVTMRRMPIGIIMVGAPDPDGPMKIGMQITAFDAALAPALVAA